MMTLMSMRTLILTDERIDKQDATYDKCFNVLTVEMFKKLLDNIDFHEYLYMCDEFDEL